MARSKTVVTENQRRSILSRYEKGTGLLEIAADDKIGVGVNVVRRILVENGIEIRGRGRPHKVEV